VTTGYTYDANNRLPQTATAGVITYYTYDNNGNLLREETPAAPSDACAHEFGAETGKLTLYTYDSLNRLVAANTDSGNACYTYAPDGLRHMKQTDVGVIYHIWNGQNMVAELDELGYLTVLYVRGVNFISANYAEEDPVYYLYNGHGDVVQLCRAPIPRHGRLTVRH
jgi:YD repeat-containing protein